MRLVIFSLLFAISLIGYANNPTGRWTFDDPENMLKASIGKDLIQTGTESPVYVEGLTANNKAIQVPKGTYFKAEHGIAPNGGGQYVNQYTIMADIRIPTNSEGWKAIFNAGMYNQNAAECFISPDGTVGIGATGYSEYKMIKNEWYRLVIAIDLGVSYRYYLDGKLVVEGKSQPVDGSVSLDPFILFFADKNGEDEPLDVAELTIFDKTLTKTEVIALGGFGHDIPDIEIPNPTAEKINPYLQSPSTNSAIMSWHGTTTDIYTLHYGKTESLGMNISSTAQTVDAGYIWHTAKLTALESNTVYYYQIKKGDYESTMYSFKTQPEVANTDKIRFLIIGDTQDHAVQNKKIVSAITDKVKEIYNDNLYNVFNAFIHVGDLVGSGSTIAQYTDQFFTPFAPITASVPTMITAGNHELEHRYFYKYVFNDEISGQSSTHSDFERYWSKQIGNTLFVGLNSTDQPSLQGIFDEQEAWLKKTLDAAEANESIDFVFCFIHAPAMSEMWGEARHNFTVNRVLPLIRKYKKVQQLTSGHTHAYERGMITKTSDGVGSSDVTLLIAGGGGGTRDRWGEYTNKDYPEIHTTIEHHFYVIGEVDVKNKSYSFKVYSLGNTDYPLNNELIDEWSISVSDVKPEKPEALSINTDGNFITLNASEYKGANPQFSSEFEVVEFLGENLSPVLNVTRDVNNFYGVTENHVPFNKNEGIDLTSYLFNKILLNNSLDSKWRVRYRDMNQTWGDWSEYMPLSKQVSIEANEVPNNISYMGNGKFMLNETGIFCLYDSSGRKVFEERINDISVPVENRLKQGIYIAKLNQKSNKIIVK